MVARDLDWGAGNHTTQLVKALWKIGIDVEVFVGNRNLMTNLIPMKLKNFDVIHVQGSPFGGLGNKRIPMITTVHSLLKKELEFEKRVSYVVGRMFERSTLRNSERVIVVSKILEKELILDYGVDKRRIVVISNGVDVSEFDRVPDRSKRENFVMSCGRPRNRKRFDILLKACQIAEIEMQLFNGQLSRRDLIKKYKEASLFVCPSSYETFGFSIAEAMAAKCPVISSEIEGVKSLVIPNETGLFFQNIEDLVNKIQYLLLNKPLRNKLVENAYNHVKTNFNWEKVAKQTIAVYEELL